MVCCSYVRLFNFQLGYFPKSYVFCKVTHDCYNLRYAYTDGGMTQDATFSDRIVRAWNDLPTNEKLFQIS